MPPRPGTVVDDLAVDLARGVVDHRHGCRLRYWNSLSISSSAPARTLGVAPRARSRARANTLLEQLRQLVDGLPHLEAHEAERRAVVEQHDEDDAARDVGEVHRLLLALVEERVEIVLADQLRQLIVGAEIGGGERRERGRIERRAARRRWRRAVRCDRRAARSARCIVEEALERVGDRARSRLR